MRAMAEKGEKPQEVYKPVVYGDFLMKKVGNNFYVDGGGRYN